MRALLSLCLLCILNMAFATPQVVVSIKPLHDLVSAVTEGIFDPVLLVPVGASPHDYALTPKQNAALVSADLVIWIGPELETFLTKPLASQPKQLGMLTLKNMRVYPMRSGPSWGTHSLVGETAPLDPHIWLSPPHAERIIQVVAVTLIKLDPEHRSVYERNAARTIERLQSLDHDMQEKLKPIVDKPYIVFHDAYQYFDRHFQTRDLGSITAHPDIPPSAKHLATITDLIQQAQVRCLFSEPQFHSGAPAHMAEQHHIKSGILDPIGDTDKTGMIAYEALLNAMADSLIQCLK